MEGPTQSKWTYAPRPDGRIAVSLDNNMWNWLFKHRATFCLETELPRSQFALFIPREVEIEYLAIGQDKAELTQFIAETIRSCDIRTTAYFGYAAPPGEVQRYGGYGFGTFMPVETRARLAEVQHFIGKHRPSGLRKNEADAFLAAQSCGSVVLSLDSNRGPLQFALSRGGKVVFVDDSHATHGNLRAAIVAIYSHPVQ